VIFTDVWLYLIRSSAAAETAHVTIASVLAVDRLTLVVTLNVTSVNFILLTQLSMHGILYPAILCWLKR